MGVRVIGGVALLLGLVRGVWHPGVGSRVLAGEHQRGAPEGRGWWRVESVSGESAVGRVRVVADDKGGNGWIEVIPADLPEIGPSGWDGARGVTRFEAGGVIRLRPASAREAAEFLIPLERRLPGRYYADPWLQQPLFSRSDPCLGFTDRDGLLDLPESMSVVSVRWEGRLIPPSSGTYRLFVASDDAAVLTVGEVVVGHQFAGGRMETGGQVDLVAGKEVTFAVEYMDVGGGKELKLEWQPPGGKREVIPVRFLKPPTEKAIGPAYGLLATYSAEGVAGSQRVVIPAATLDWERAPWEGMAPSGGWSVTLRGTFLAREAGRHWFKIVASREVAVSVGGQPVELDRQQVFSVDSGGSERVPIEMRLSAHPGRAESLRLEWKRPGFTTWQPLPHHAMELPEEVPLRCFEPGRPPLRFNRNEVGGEKFEARVNRGGLRVAWWAGGKLVATTVSDEQGIARLERSRLPPGRQELVVRAEGYETAGVWMEVEGLSSDALSGPWLDYRVGEAIEPVKLESAGAGVIELTSEGTGDVLGGADLLRLVGRKLAGDGEARAELETVKGVRELGGREGMEVGTGALGGLMLRDRMIPNGRFVAVIRTSEGEYRLLLRRENWANVEVLPLDLGAGGMVRLSREGEMVRVLTKREEGGLGDGSWRTVRSEPFGFYDGCYAGMFVVSRSGGARLRLRDFSVVTPEPSHVGREGIVLTSGSYLQGNLVPVEDAGVIAIDHRGGAHRFARESVARVHFTDCSTLREEMLASAVPSILLRGVSDDLIRGRVVNLTDHVVEVDTPLFGVRTFTKREVRSVALAPVVEGGTAVDARDARGGDREAGRRIGIVLLAEDGSRLLGGRLRATPQGLTVTDDRLPMDYPGWSLESIREVKPR